MAHRDFVIGSLAQFPLPTFDEASSTQLKSDVAALVARHTRAALVDLSGLARELLLSLRVTNRPAARALLLAQVLSEVSCEVRCQLAIAVVTRLPAFELTRVARAGLLALDEACSLADPMLRGTLHKMVGAALSRTARPALVGSVLLCAEGVSPAMMARAVASLRGRRRGVQADSVRFVIPSSDSVLTVQEACDLLAAEARLSDDAQLARFAAQAAAGNRSVVREVSLLVPPSLLRRLADGARSLWRREMYGEIRPSRQHGWGWAG